MLITDDIEQAYMYPREFSFLRWSFYNGCYKDLVAFMVLFVSLSGNFSWERTNGTPQSQFLAGLNS